MLIYTRFESPKLFNENRKKVYVYVLLALLNQWKMLRPPNPMNEMVFSPSSSTTMRVHSVFEHDVKILMSS